MKEVGFKRSFKNNLNTKSLNIITFIALSISLVVLIMANTWTPLMIAVLFMVGGRLIVSLENSMDYICPSCNHIIHHKYPGKYCSNCGTKIPWEEVRKKNRV